MAIKLRMGNFRFYAFNHKIKCGLLTGVLLKHKQENDSVHNCNKKSE